MEILDNIAIIAFILTQLWVSSTCLYEINRILYDLKINFIISLIFGLVLLFPTMMLTSLLIFDISYIKYGVFNLVSVLISSSYVLYYWIFYHIKKKIKENCISLDTDRHINSLYTFTIILLSILYVIAMYYHISFSLFLNK